MVEDKENKDEVIEDSVSTQGDENNEILEDETNVQEEPKQEEVDPIALRDAKIQELEKELEEQKASYLRKHADFENFRKRLIKEKADAIKHANENLITDLIDVIDNFDRALLSSAENTDFDAFKEGIGMIEKQFKGMLSSNWGLSKIESVGEEFDPQIHEAMFMEDSETVETPQVAEEYQSGYKLHDKVLRAPKVKVIRPVTA